MSPKLDQLADAVADRVADRLADRLAELVEAQPAAPAEPELIDAATVAKRFGVSRDWAYDHADELGAVRLGPTGEGRRPRLRFDPAKVAEALGQREPEPAPQPTGRRSRRRPSEVELLPVGPKRGRE